MEKIIRNVMDKLSTVRPVFHSEADFQHAFAWEMHNIIPDGSFRLEYRPKKDERLYVDFWLCVNGHKSLAIELKYKTRVIDLNIHGESYALKNQSAQDCGRYDFLKDLQRIEDMVITSDGVIGYALMLTNDSAYWNKGKADTIDAQFRIHEGRKVNGKLQWADSASKGTIKSREKPINLVREYSLGWTPYSSVQSKKYGELRYLLVPVI